MKYLRDLGVYETVNEREAIAKYQLAPIDTRWIDTDSVRGRAHANQINNCCERIQE